MMVNTMKAVCALLLVALVTVDAAEPSTKQVADFAKAHSGPAAGVVTWTGKGTGSEKKIGACSLRESQAAHQAEPRNPGQ